MSSPIPIPKELQRQGLKGYSSNLQPGDRVKIPTRTFFLFFEKELMARCTTQGDAVDAETATTTE